LSPSRAKTGLSLMIIVPTVVATDDFLGNGGARGRRGIARMELCLSDQDMTDGDRQR